MSKATSPEIMHQLMAETLDKVFAEIKRIQSDARSKGFTEHPCWPMIILRTPKGWTGPKEVDGLPIEGTFRAHQVPIGDMDRPGHVKLWKLDEELSAARTVRRAGKAAAGVGRSAPKASAA